MAPLALAGVEIARARCAGWEGFRNGRKHLVDIDRLVNPRVERRGTRNGGYIDTITATGQCPVCGAGWRPYFGEFSPAGRFQHYDSIVVHGFLTDDHCTAACLNSASAECKCSCGGWNHGMQA